MEGFKDDLGASADADRATHEPSPTVSALRVGIPSAVLKAIEFYALPENWHGVYMVGRGPMADDWSDDYDDDQYSDGKPGKLAREAWRALDDLGYFSDDLAMQPPPDDWVATPIEGVDPADMMAWSPKEQAQG